MTDAHRYCLISPARDEERYARRTLDSVVAQTIRPALWVIVDDGSKDATPAILAEYAAQHDWIRVVRREDRGHRKLGGGVIDAFYAGYETITPTDFDYVCKLDLDLDLPPIYFEELMRRMVADPRIGTCSGKPYMELHGQLVSEGCGDDHSVGMVKFYRTACFEQIGGFVRELMWDGIDGHRCRMLGWRALSWMIPRFDSNICARWARAIRTGGPAACATALGSITWARPRVIWWRVPYRGRCVRPRSWAARRCSGAIFAVSWSGASAILTRSFANF